MNTDLINDLKALNPILGQTQPSHREAFDELRDGIATQIRPLPAARAARWIGAAAAAAAVVTATVLLWPGNPATGPVPAIPATTPSPTTLGTWQKTAPSPLSPRHSSITAWVDGTFLVVGGDTTASCGPAEDCLHPANLVRDGARYDPATNTWTKIADAPMALVNDEPIPDAHPLTAVLGHTVYVITTSGSGQYGVRAPRLLAYDADADRWKELPSPAAQPLNLVSTTDSVIAFTGTQGYESFDPAVGRWVRHHVNGLPQNIAGGVLVGGRLAVAGVLGHNPSKPDYWVGTVDLATDRATLIDRPASGMQRPMPAGVQTASGGFAVWGRSGSLVWLLDPATGTWTSVERPATSGTFSGTQQGVKASWFVTAAGMIALNGHLYDPETSLWSPTPALPVPGDDPVIASGPESVLVCFGFDGTSGKAGKGCYHLRPSPATSKTP